MEPYSIAPRPSSGNSPLAYRPADSLPARQRSRPLIKPASTRWNRDMVLAGAGLALVLLGLMFRGGDPVLLAVGLPVAAGLVFFLGWPAWQKHRAGGSWSQRREALLERWEAVADQLTPQAEKRYTSLSHRVSRLGDLFPAAAEGQGSLLRPGEYCLWLYLKLLLALDHLEESVRDSREEDVIAHRQRLLEELDSAHLSPAARQSTHETVLILDQRVLTLRSRPSRVREIESDLIRVEQWVALMHDQAAQHNALGDAGRRLRFGPESLSLPSLEALPGASLRDLDELMNSQA